MGRTTRMTNSPETVDDTIRGVVAPGYEALAHTFRGFLDKPCIAQGCQS